MILNSSFLILNSSFLTLNSCVFLGIVENVWNVLGTAKVEIVCGGVNVLIVGNV